MRNALLILRIELLWIRRLATRPEDWTSLRDTLAACATLAEGALEQLAVIEGALKGSHDSVA